MSAFVTYIPLHRDADALLLLLIFFFFFILLLLNLQTTELNTSKDLKHKVRDSTAMLQQYMASPKMKWFLTSSLVKGFPTFVREIRGWIPLWSN